MNKADEKGEGRPDSLNEPGFLGAFLALLDAAQVA